MMAGMFSPRPPAPLSATEARLLAAQGRAASALPTDATPSLWFGYWMGCADTARMTAVEARILARSPLLSVSYRQTFLAAAYACDLQHDACLQHAIAWGSR